MSFWETVKWWIGDLFKVCYWFNHHFTVINTYGDRVCSRCGLERFGKVKNWEVV